MHDLHGTCFWYNEVMKIQSSNSIAKTMISFEASVQKRDKKIVAKTRYRSALDIRSP